MYLCSSLELTVSLVLSGGWVTLSRFSARKYRSHAVADVPCLRMFLQTESDMQRCFLLCDNPAIMDHGGHTFTEYSVGKEPLAGVPASSQTVQEK